MKPSTSAGPSRRRLLLAFGGAAVVAVVLVAIALLLRDTGGGTTVSEGQAIDFTGIPQDGPLLGSPAAKVTLIEYADPQCPVCRTFDEELLPVVVQEYVRPGRVAVELRGFPFIGDDSVKAYRFLLAAGEQDRLWQLQDALYRNQGGENEGWVTDDLIRELAAAIPGLDVERLFADAESANIVAEAERAPAQAAAAGIEGTPTLLVAIGNADPYQIQVGSADEMRAALDDALRG